MPESSDALAYASLAVGTAGFIRFGWCLVYLICDADHLAPAWVQRAALTTANAVDRVRLAVVQALLSLLLRLSTVKGAVR
ncbi:hypothetical protein [Streptomyces sp. NPDC052114]|uniref:hypothetical protein n=1 Tax=unclassified Streptomyces TaxID=2593676 RepID=UPI00344AF074